MKAQILVVVAFVALTLSCGGSDFVASTEQPDVVTDSGVSDTTNVPDTTNEIDSNTIVDASPDVTNDTTQDTTEPVDSGSKCTAGAIDCQGKTPRFCNQNEQWETKSDCKFLCVEGTCKGECNPGSKQCKDTELQFCNANGEWQHSENCAVSCDKGANPPACIGRWCCNSNDITQVDYKGSCGCYTQVTSCPAVSPENSCVASNYNCCFTYKMYKNTGGIDYISCNCFNAYSEQSCDSIILKDKKDSMLPEGTVINKVDSCPLK